MFLATMSFLQTAPKTCRIQYHLSSIPFNTIHEIARNVQFPHLAKGTSSAGRSNSAVSRKWPNQSALAVRQSCWFLLYGNSHVFKLSVDTKPLLVAEQWSKCDQVCQKAKSNTFAKALPYQPSMPAEFLELCTHKTKKHCTVLQILWGRAGIVSTSYSSCSRAALLRKKKLRNDFKRPGKSKPSFDLTNDLTIAEIFFISPASFVKYPTVGSNADTFPW